MDSLDRYYRGYEYQWNDDNDHHLMNHYMISNNNMKAVKRIYRRYYHSSSSVINTSCIWNDNADSSISDKTIDMTESEYTRTTDGDISYDYDDIGFVNDDDYDESQNQF